MSGSTQYIRPLVVRHVDNETPAGAIDGLNTTYTTQFKFNASSLKVFLNGLKLRPGISNDYTILGNQSFVMNYAPLPGDVVIVDYLRQTNT